uniref:Uncharacterized protein n=1 Tax=Haemonchus contortus TaxID=6289 RepID=A0A7I4Y913_HAECO
MMYVMLILLSVLTVGLAVQPSAAQLPVNHAYKDGNTLRIPIDANASEELFDKWLSQALSGLMAAVTSGRLDQMDEDDREEIHRCSKMAYTVPDHARCVVKVLDTTRHIKRIPTSVKRTPAKVATKVVKSGIDRSDRYITRSLGKRISHVKRKPIKRKMKEFIPRQNDEWVGGFRLARAKRSIKLVNRTSYNLTSIDDETFFSKVVRQTARTIRKFKNKTDGTQSPRDEPHFSWRSAIQRIKHIGKEARMMAKQRKALKKRLRQMIDNTPDDFQDPRKAAAIRQMEMEDEDLAMKKKIGMEKKEEIRVPMKLVRESIKIALAATGKNVSNFDDKTLKLLSPRFLSIVPEQDPDDLFNLLSPSLFSIHEEGSEVEKTLSLPNLVKALPNKDQEAWLDFIVEAAGVSDAIDMTEKKQQEMREEGSRGPDGTPLYFTKKNVTDIFGDTEKRKIETFEELDRLYTKSQREDLDKQGYSYLTLKQLDVIYGPNSPYNKSDSHQLFRKLRRLHDDPHHLIEHDIRALAEAKKFRVRQKDIALSPFVLTPLNGAGAALSTTVVLSPLVLSPITLSPAVLGPIILSPWVFVPLILSPRVLSPLIVNPLIFSPIILSPLVLHPLILVPGVFNPVILSPLVLSPLILSPQVFTPIVLSPLLLSPLIYNPMAGSPLVLSPFLLSPIICSPQYLFAVVLSPYALSPLIQSKLIASEVILSPNWLS